MACIAVSHISMNIATQTSLIVWQNVIFLNFKYFYLDAQLQFYLDDFDSEADIITAVNNLTFITGNTVTGRALEMARTQIFDITAGDRPGAPNIIVVLTDGISTNPNVTQEEADILRNSNTLVITIGIGPYLDANELKNLATDSRFIFRVGDFDKLQNIVENITFCPGKH